MAYKHDYDVILVRLTRILSRLHNGEALSVKELKEEFSVSDRTIQRDFTERLSSFPIYKEKKKWQMKAKDREGEHSGLEEVVLLDFISKLMDNGGEKFSKKAHALLDKINHDTKTPICSKVEVGSYTPRTILLNISSDISHHVKENPILSSQKIEVEHKDGSLDISVEITNDMDIIPLVKSCLPHMKVLSPDVVAEKINKDLKAYLKTSEHNDDGMLDSLKLIKLYFTKNTKGVMKNIDTKEDSNVLFLNKRFLFLDKKGKKNLEYEKIDECYKDGWRIVLDEKNLKNF